VQREGDLSFEKLLLVRALSAKEVHPLTTETRDRLNDWRGAVVGCVLLLLGLSGLLLCPSIRGQRVSEAVMIAGLLSIVVDPFLKKRLVKEASKDIFHHLLGFELPVQIRERLRDIVLKTDLYREDLRITCAFTETDDKMIRIEFETSYEVVNPTHDVLEFHQLLDFEKAENARLNRISCDQARKGYGKTATLTFNDESDLFEYKGKGIKIEPSGTKKRYRFSADYSVEGFPVPGFHVQMFKYPTIGLTVRIRNRPPSLIISTDIGSGDEGQWTSDRLFMPGDHFNIRWERTNCTSAVLKVDET